jgi:hypothetical protein
MNPEIDHLRERIADSEEEPFKKKFHSLIRVRKSSARIRIGDPLTTVPSKLG